MTDEILQLKQKVFSAESPPRDLIVRYFKALAAEAKKYPVNKRDDLASEILMPFNQLANPPEDDPALEYIVFQLAGGYLDVMQENVLAMNKNPDDRAKYQKFKAEVWKELIYRIEALA